MRIRNSAEIAALNEGSTISRPPVLHQLRLSYRIQNVKTVQHVQGVDRVIS